MTAPRAWADYLHGPGVFVPCSVAAWLNDRYRLDLVRGQVRGTDPDVDAVLMAITQAAKAWRLTDYGSIPGLLPEPDGQWISTRKAAGILGVSDRAVRAAIATRKLPAEQVDGRWRIQRHDIDNYRTARRDRAA